MTSQFKAKNIYKVLYQSLAFCFLSLPLQMLHAQVPGPVILQGTGGTVTTQGSDVIHTFTTGGTFTPPPGVTQVEVLVVGGGGGGGAPIQFGTAGGAGGGAGGLVYNAIFPVGGAVPVTVGAGGVGGSSANSFNPGANGSNSSFGTITALGGGGGAGGNAQGLSGGSGGGSRGAAGGVATQPGSPSGGFGFRGGNFPGSPGGAGASGGGGAGGTGEDLPGNVGQAGNGGPGLQYPISGIARFYAGGGGGGNANNNPDLGLGGSGVGGTGGNSTTPPTPGTPNRGGGGGGGNDNTAGAAGGSGVVIVRYTAPTLTITQQASANATTTVPFAQQPVIRLLNGAGAPVSGVNIAASIASGSGTLAGTVTVATDGSGQALFSNLAITGNGNHTIRFTPAGFTQNVVSNIINIIPPPTAACPNFQGISMPVVYLDCTELKDTNGGAGIIFSPPATQIGDFLVLAISADAVQAITPPTGWTTLDVGQNVGSGNNDVTFGVYSFFATSAGAISYDVSTSGGNDYYAWMMSFRNTKGIDPSEVAVGSGDGNNATSPAVTTAIDNSLILRLIGANDDDAPDDDEGGFTSPIMTGHIDITQDSSNTGGGTSSGAGVYTMQGAAGSSGTGIFNNFPGNEEWRAVTVALRPIVPFYKISHLNVGFRCSQNLITISRDDGFGSVDTSFTGTITLSTSTGNGSWAIGGSGAQGVLSDVTPGDGIATYTFDAADNGEVILEFSDPNIEVVNFDITDGSYTEDPGFDPDLDVQTCSFLISHGNTGGTCAPSGITITAFDTGYTGTITLSTTTGNGSWSVGSGGAMGVLTDGTPDDGIATYTFVAGDNGEVILEFTDLNSETVNFDITDGTYSESPLADDDLVLTACEFRISHAGTGDTCAPDTINFRVSDAFGNTVTTFTGTVSLTTNTTSGFWAQGSANGVLSGGPGDGTATYVFDNADNGIASLEFFETTPSSVNFNITDGSFFESGSFDPDLVITACAGVAPNIFDLQCYNDVVTGTVDIPSQAANGSRMVLMSINSEGNPTFPTSATFDVGASNFAMTQVESSYLDDGNFDILTEVWAILDTDMPAAAGTYTADFSGGGGDTSICLISLTDVEQVIPPGTGAGQPVNFTNADNPGTNQVSTSITTQADNAFVLSSAGNGENNPWSSSTLGGAPLWNFVTNNQQTFAGFSAIIPTAGPLTVTDTGEAGNNFNRVGHVVTAFSPAPALATHFRITHNNIGALCTNNVVTISAYNDFGSVQTNYTGAVTISTTSLQGDWISLGNGVFNNGAGNDGIATYTFDPADNGVVQLAFSQPVTGTVNFNVTDGSISEWAFFDNDLVIGNCFFRISNVGNAYTCSYESISITAADAAGNILTAYSGTINLSTTTGNGSWVIGSGNGTLTDVTPGDGIATYTFDVTDNGVAVLGFNVSVVETVNINVTDGTYSEDPIFDPDIDVLDTCEFRISHSGNAGTCSPEPVTISVFDGDGNPGNVFTGTINLSTNTGNGTWSINTGAGTLNDPSADDGLASYTFDATDAGVVVLDFFDIHTEVVNFNVTGGFTVNSGFDPDLTVSPCAFRISHSGSSDMCTPEAVTITVVDSTGATLTGYDGTILLSTDTGNGSWSLNTGAGIFTDAVNDDGAASYNFDPADNGVLVLNYLNPNAETVNINVTDGAINEDPLFDPDLVVDLCTFRITTATGTLSACTFETITIEVYDSGGALATNYMGTVDIITDTANGNWVSSTGAGVLNDVSPNDGIASYAFDVSDGGSVDIIFTSETVETLNINLNDNGIIEEPGFDPDIDVTACLPTVTDVQCYTNQNQANAITIASSAATGGSRMVLMYTSTESLTPATGSTLDGGTYVLTQLKNETANFGIGHVLQVYGILDANLPAGGGTYSAQFTGSANGPAMCLVALEGVKQAFPVDNGNNTGQLNGSNAQNTQAASTSVTTVENNSIVLSVVANGQGGTSYTSTLGNSLWPTGAADANSSDWAGNSDFQPVTGLVTVDETNSATPNRHAHIVMALAPIVAGAPFASDYVPVSLFQSYSGNIGYRAIGNSLRNQPNGVNACSFVPEATGSTADLTIPAGSSVLAGYVYWAGSGTQVQEDPTVTFGPTGSEISITADDMFHIVNPYGLGNEFFAGYKDVTPLISNTATTTYHFSDLAVQTGPPWSTYQGCLGGWGIVVIFENLLENLNTINLFHGFQPFRFSSFQLTARNFRMASPDGVNIPNGQITHLTFEGDDSLNQPGELLELQNNPLSLTFTALVNSVNPALSQGGAVDAQYNDTVTYPAYDGNLDFLPAGGDDGQGYFIDNITSYGTDVDTYYLQGAIPGEILYPFANIAAEQISLRYGSGQDGVLLVGEFFQVTNAPIADLEVFISEGGTFKVDNAGAGAYSYTVTNNGNGAISQGYANGDVILTINLPLGMTSATITAPGWTCIPDVPVPNATAFTCVFEIANDWISGLGAATDFELAGGESLPSVDITVNLDNETSYPLVSNPVTQSARIAHVGDYTTCIAVPVGVQPDPAVCSLAPQFDNVNDLNNNTIDIDDLDVKTANQNNVVEQLTNVQGIITDLSISKSVVGVLEENKPGIYLLAVTNNGPDVTSKTITITDTLPAGLVPNTAGGTDWTCNIISQDVTCIRSAALGVAASTDITITTVSVASPAIEGAFVTNTAVVQAGTFNFDPVPGNNSDTDITQVVGTPVASNEKFLISVNETSSISGLGPFEDGDLVLYDPVLDQGTLFLAESAIPGVTNLNNVNALHLLPNGQILISSDTDGSSIASVSFDEGDIVLYDPILETATLIFDGSTVFTGAADIDAIHINYNDSYDDNAWDIVFSTVDDSVIAGVIYDDNDLIIYDVSAGTASLLVDGASGDVFNGDNGDIDAAYIRYNNANVYTLSTDGGTTTIGINGIQDTYTQDDLVQIDLTTPGTPDAGNVFLGNVANGIFTPASGTRKLDALHVVEDGYFGHFAIVHGGSSDTCTPTTITLRKHIGLSHVTDTNYAGSVIISNDIAEGTWSKDVTANGTITDMGSGVAVYTFDPADSGEVILYLTQVNPTVMNVDVTNFFVVEDSVEDSDIIVSDVVTSVSYADQFSSVAYSNNDGIASFSSNWLENNDDGNPSTGAVKVISNRLNLTNPGGSTFPEIQRTIDFSGYSPNTATNPLTMSFNWNRTNGAPADTFQIQARSMDSDPWTTLQTIGGLTGAVGSTPVSIDMTAAGISPTISTQIKFVLSAGYQLESFNLDNVQVTTATNDCNVGGAVDHYAITHSGFGISCLATNITITPHTLADFPVAPGPGVILTLNTSTNRGSWGTPLNGAGPFSAVAGTGQATYTYQPGETAIIFPFNYTNPVTDPESVSINVADNSVPANIELEDPTLDVATAGLRFFNDTTSTEIYPTLVSGMNSFLYTNQLLTVQAIQASDDNPAVCENIFGPGTDVVVELAFECADPAACSAGVIPVSVTNNGNTTSIEPVDNNAGPAANPGGYDPVTLRFETFTNGDFDLDPGPGTNFSYTGAQIQLNYADAGSLQMHGRYNVPLLDGAGAQTGNFMQGSGSNNFVVRPFGYDVDVIVLGMPDRQTNGNDPNADSWAVDAIGSAFFTAGAGFDTSVRAIAWQAADDDGSTGGIANDGIPDPGSDLYDNPSTPNYGNESDPAQNDMTIIHALDASMPVGAVTGTLSTSNFTNFGSNNGSETHSMAWNEVGIIDLTAALDSGDYLGSGEGIYGELMNLGRFIPADFEVSLTNLIDRPLFSPTASPFTYMGEEFTAEFTLTARNVATNVTQNYIGDFAKLDTPGELSFFAVEDIASSGDDIDYSSRLGASVVNGIAADYSANWSAGVVSLSGNFIFNRQASGAEEAPITSLQIALTALDDDAVVDSGRNVDDDDGITEPGISLYNLIGTQEFRYGRLRLENAYGSEIPETAEDADDINVTGEDLPVIVVAEYYDGTNWVINTDDVATPYNSSDLSFVTGSYTDNLDDGEVVIVANNGVIYQGKTESRNVTDIPLQLTAPGEGNEGSVVIELDLTTPELEFLRYDWRGAGEIEDENPDGNFTNNPRAYVEFGTFQTHERIIFWQELFVVP